MDTNFVLLSMVMDLRLHLHETRLIQLCLQSIIFSSILYFFLFLADGRNVSAKGERPPMSTTLFEFTCLNSFFLNDNDKTTAEPKFYPVAIYNFQEGIEFYNFFGDASRNQLYSEILKLNVFLLSRHLFIV